MPRPHPHHSQSGAATSEPHAPSTLLLEAFERQSRLIGRQIKVKKTATPDHYIPQTPGKTTEKLQNYSKTTEKLQKNYRTTVKLPKNYRTTVKLQKNYRTTVKLQKNYRKTTELQ